VDFKPLVKLNEVEVKTGEEDEDILFKQRCKLYRFDNSTKEWKEKGVGELKILKHKLREGYYRVLMRRDQVLKLCANHRITADMRLETVNEKQLRWLANDCAEGEARPEMLAVRFRHEDDTKQFRAEFERAQASAKSGGVVTGNTPQKPAAAAVTNSLAAALVKQGDWQCTGCYATNKAASEKCACCETARPSASAAATTGSNKSTDNGN
jgi:E3 SUMO-protein ligase RanBP2